jgi:chemotaxis family two-component system response regulator Rcp1
MQWAGLWSCLIWSGLLRLRTSYYFSRCRTIFVEVIPAPPIRQILLAEDNPADVFLVREALRRGEIECDLRVIADGEEAISFIDGVDADSKRPGFDLLLLDMHLPRRDGEYILSHLRASERSSRTPVIVMTSSDSPADKRKVERHAPVQFFRKPASLDEFMELGMVVKRAMPDA